MKNRLLVAALAVGLAASTAVATPAHAVPPPPPGIPAVAGWLSCASGQTTGSITSATLSSWVTESAQIDVITRITPCQMPVPYSAFVAVKYFPATDSAPVSALTRTVAYAATTATSTYRITVTVTPQNTAICVASGPDTRLDCVGLSWPTGTVTPVVTGHIPVDDSRVLTYIQLPGTGLQHPGCPLCWY